MLYAVMASDAVMANVASKVPFGDLCRLCEKISNKQGKENKAKALADFVQRWRDFHQKLHVNDNNVNDSFYPAMRLLLPKFEKERSAYGIKEVTLAKIYIEILNLNKERRDAQSLLNFRAPKNAKADAGDFASVAYNVLRNRCPDTGKLTIEDVNDHLDKVSFHNAAKDKGQIKYHLLQLLRNTSATEQKWLIRMIMKDMKMGLSEQSILNVFHADGQDLYDVSNNLSKVCTVLHDPGKRLHEIEISLFNPFRPMLGDRAVPEKVEKLMDKKEFFVEVKYDGERMQLHKKGDRYKFYSRNGNDYSDVFGSSPFTGTIARHIHNLFDSRVDSCILDGEMVGYHTKLKIMGSKGQNFDVKCLQDGDEYQPMFCVFDILLFNDKVLSNLKLNERLAYLNDDLFKECDGRLRNTEHKIGRCKDDVVDALNEAIDNREEGIVVKNPDSLYKPNSRKAGWLKIKPEYVDSVMEQLDLIIIGGYFGEGRRKGMISHFLLGVAVPNTSGEAPGVFHSVGKVGSGYSLQELYELCRKLNDHWQVYSKRNPPANVILAQGHKEKPDVFIEPSKSFIVQVKAAEIINSDRFKTGCTLRFPRVEAVRYDKTWKQCMTTTELFDLRQQASGKLASKRLLNDQDGEESVSKKPKTGIVSRQPLTVAPHFRGADLSAITKESNIFDGKEMCVLNGTSSQTKQDLEKFVATNGGVVVQNPSSNVFCLLANRIDLRTKNMIRYRAYDVVKCDWLLRCVSDRSFIPWVPSDMIHSSRKTSESFSSNYDKYGDSFTDDATPEDLRKVFDGIAPDKMSSRSEIAEMEREYFPNTSKMGLFRQYRFYIDNSEKIGIRDGDYGVGLSLSVCESRLYGGTISDQLDAYVSHVILDERRLIRLKEFRSLNRRRRIKFHIVTKSWISDCIKSNAILPERSYEPL
ncbi:LIG4 (predicted) [Pycnogonum litorale]